MDESVVTISEFAANLIRYFISEKWSDSLPPQGENTFSSRVNAFQEPDVSEGPKTGARESQPMERSQNSFCVCVAQKLSLNSTQNTESLAKLVSNL